VFVDLYLQRMDLTERKLIEEELRKAKAEAEMANAAKDHFLAALSHELRTPLTPVVALLPTILESDSLSEEMRDDLLMIQRNVQLETHLINDLLDLTLITKGRLHLNLQRTDAHSALRRVLQITTSEAAAKEITIDTDLAATDFHVWGDPARLEQVFWNLLRNAIKFSKTGQQVCVKTSNVHPAVLQVDVIDTGVGLDPAQLKRIFKAFEQPHDAAGHRFGGLGMGLFISQAIAAQHGTNIQAISKGRDCGATFRLELRTTNAPQEASEEEALSTTLTRRGLRILLVEDHDNTRQVLTRLLTKSGHEVKAAENVQTAMELAEEHEFDLIISDLGLPDGSGLELMPELKQRYGLKGIAVSGYGREEDLQKSRIAGFSAHLIKPLNFEDLELTVSRVAGLEAR
ncbi:MAG: response regulator, partial [Chthoniobacteraceae bacterium]